MDADKEIPYRIAYEEAVHALSQQQITIDSLSPGPVCFFLPPQ